MSALPLATLQAARAVLAPTTLLAGLLAGLLATAPAQAITTTTAASNWLGSTIAGLDGVAQLVMSSGSGCSGSLLAGGAWVLTAAHCVTDDSGVLDTSSISLRFLSGTVTATVSSAAQIDVFDSWTGTAGGSNDLALLRLDSAISGISGYGIYSADPMGLDITLAGYGYTGLGSSGYTTGSFGTLHWGENTYEALYNGAGSAYVFDFDDGTRRGNALGDLGLGSTEASVAPGDSGGASFVQVGGEWLLVGVHSFGTSSRADADGSINASYGELAADSVLWRADTQAWLASVTAVPEPATSALWLGGLLGLGSWRQRRAGRDTGRDTGRVSGHFSGQFSGR